VIRCHSDWNWNQPAPCVPTWPRVISAFSRSIAIGLSGLVHAHTFWRPLAALSDEEVQALDAITKKLVAPASNASQNAHQNQIESKPALEAEVTASEASDPTSRAV
jgi:hypothetical protein